MGSAKSIRADEYMSVAAHDLRNPIAVMRASAQMALRQVDRGDLDAARRRIGAVIDQADRVSDMLEMFVDAARIDAATLPLKPEVVDMADVVREALDRANRATPGRAERPLQLELADGCVGHFDRVRIGRAVRALLDNALVYGNPAVPVRVCLVGEGSRLRLTINGGGPGPLPEEVPRLFERFFRGHAAAEAGHAGSGLGLYTARGIARAHGGDVRHSPRESPDEFELELPLRVPSA